MMLPVACISVSSILMHAFTIEMHRTRLHNIFGVMWLATGEFTLHLTITVLLSSPKLFA